jgi:hypothetical protein
VRLDRNAIFAELRRLDFRADDLAMSRSLGPEIDPFDSLDLFLQVDALGNDIAMTKPC